MQCVCNHCHTFTPRLQLDSRRTSDPKLTHMLFAQPLKVTDLQENLIHCPELELLMFFFLPRILQPRNGCSDMLIAFDQTIFIRRK